MNQPLPSLFDDYVPETPFSGRVVCSAGTFRLSPRALAQRLLQMGADYKPSARPSRNVHFVLLGQNPPADVLDALRQLRFHGYSPRVLNPDELDDILAGHYAGYHVPQQIQKDLRLTPDHFQQLRLSYEGSLNPLYTREVYVDPLTRTPQPRLYQMMGNRGIYANPYIDDTTDCLLLAPDTLDSLRQGRPNPTISYIQQTYNQSRAQYFRFAMTSEEDLLRFLSC